MKNVYDIRYEKNLLFILPENEKLIFESFDRGIYKKTAVIVYLYYIDTLPAYYKYIDDIPQAIDLYILSSREDVLDAVRRHLKELPERKVSYICKENRGRDVSALLIAGRDIVANYEYVCFLHDKREHCKERKEDTEFWIENLWGNQIGTGAYITNILGLFHDNRELGVLAPPEPVGKHFNTWYGYGWYHSFEITKEIAQRLQLSSEIRRDKPPITFGTVLWFRSSALYKLFEIGWNYSDFDDEKLKEGNYLSYGIERIFAYVAQDAGYDTGTVMTCSYAGKAMNQLQYITNRIFAEKDQYFPIDNLKDLQCFEKNKDRMIRFAKENKKLYLYGAGKMARFCAAVLRRENILPEAYLVSRKPKNSMIECIPVITADKLNSFQDIAVIITVYDANMQNEIADVLEGYHCRKYINMWEGTGHE